MDTTSTSRQEKAPKRPTAEEKKIEQPKVYTQAEFEQAYKELCETMKMSLGFKLMYVPTNHNTFETQIIPTINQLPTA